MKVALINYNIGIMNQEISLFDFSEIITGLVFQKNLPCDFNHLEETLLKLKKEYNDLHFSIVNNKSLGKDISKKTQIPLFDNIIEKKEK